jgi:DNA-binding SARP family transcriptional activator
VCGGTRVDLGGPQQQAVLMLLLTKDNVRTDELVRGLWGGSPPPAAEGVVRTYLCRLRRLLSRCGLEIGSRNGHHALDPSQFALDATEFTELVRQKRLEEALGLWTGTALAGVPGEAAERERFRLEQRKLAAVLELFALRLASGQHAQVAAEAPLVIHRHRLEERLYELYLVALHRCGRRAQALEVYRDVYDLLGRELGVTPGPRLRAAHEMVIRAD